jgi:large subunit ribosomal protein L18
MNAKNIARIRRARQTRIRIRDNGAIRLTVHRSNGHIYAQIVTPTGDKILASASSLEKDVRGQLKNGATRKAAELVGQRIAAKAKEKGIDQVAFDRAGYRYHGRVKALAEAARSGGLKF